MAKKKAKKKKDKRDPVDDALDVQDSVTVTSALASAQPGVPMQAGPLVTATTATTGPRLANSVRKRTTEATKRRKRAKNPFRGRF